MKARSLLLLIMFIIILVWLQLAVEGGFNFLSGRVNLILAALVVLINLVDSPLIIIFAAASGLLLDVYSGLPFGILTAALFFTAVILEVLFINFFTNFSLYSLLLLGLIAVVAYNFLFLAIIAVIYFLGFFDSLPQWNYAWELLWQIITTVLIMVLAYLSINRLSRQFKPMFLK